MSQICIYCKQPKILLIKCDGCAVPGYCSLECKNLDSTAHSLVCKDMPQNHQNILAKNYKIISG